jgi:hypothetical protein
MSDSTKKVLMMIVAVIVGIWALKFVFALALALVYQVVIPVLVIGGIGYGLYYIFGGGRKGIGSGNRRSLP